MNLTAFWSSTLKVEVPFNVQSCTPYGTYTYSKLLTTIVRHISANKLRQITSLVTLAYTFGNVFIFFCSYTEAIFRDLYHANGHITRIVDKYLRGQSKNIDK